MKATTILRRAWWVLLLVELCACRSAPVARQALVQREDVQSVVVQAPARDTWTAVLALLEEREYEVKEREAQSRVRGELPAQTRFLSLLGERTKVESLELWLEWDPPRQTRVRAQARVSEGAAGSAEATTRSSGDRAWYDALFEDLRTELLELGIAPYPLLPNLKQN